MKFYIYCVASLNIYVKILIQSLLVRQIKEKNA